MDKGWKIVPVLSQEKAFQITESIKDDIINITFGLSGEKDNFNNCPNKWELFTDVKLREQYLNNSKCIWKNNFSQTPHLSKSCGMVNIFHNPLVRNEILFNNEIISHIKSEYNENVFYAKGPERVSLKPKGSIDMAKHIDNSFVNPENRIQAFVTLEIDSTKEKDNGSIAILSNFNNYFFYYSFFINENPSYKGETFTLDKNPIQLDELFISSIAPFNLWLKENFYTFDIKEKYSNFKNKHTIPDLFQKIEWEQPALKNGDLFVWDSKCPHYNTRNKSDICRVVAYISLYPRSTWENLGKPNIYNMFIGKTKSFNGEKNRDNNEEKEFYSSVWNERTNIDTNNPSIQQLIEYIE